MLEEKIVDLKEKISYLYNMYLECDNKREYITKLTKIFNITIFEVLANNYKILSVDIDNLSIVIEDIRYKIVYNSSYVFNSKGIFIETIETGNERYLKRVYSVDKDKLLTEHMIFEKDVKVLEFIKEYGINNLNDKKKLTIRYSVNNNGVYHPLLTKIYECNNNDSFERIYTYNGMDYNNVGNLVDKSMYVDDSNMVYIVDDLAIKTPILYLKGICFENTQIDITKYKVNGMNLYEYEDITNGKTTSAIVFKGVVDNEFCLLEIYKNSELINIKYHKENNLIENDKDMQVLFESIEIPILKKGKISVLEIYSIIKELKKDMFINIVVNELNNFSEKIYIKDKLMMEEFDPLSPKLLLSKDFYVILDAISRGKDGYFNLIDSQFEALAIPNERNKYYR